MPMHMIKTVVIFSNARAQGYEPHRFSTTRTLSDFPLLIGEILRRGELRAQLSRCTKLGDCGFASCTASGKRQLMIQQVLHRPQWQSRVRSENLRALTPLIYSHVTPYGRFHLDMTERLVIETAVAA